jgi:hypothetical protein
MDWAAAKPTATDFLDLEAHTATYFGKFGKARKLSRRAMQSAKQNNSVGEAWRAVANQVLREALVGNIEEARRAEAAFNDYSPSSHGYYGHSSQEYLLWHWRLPAKQPNHIASWRSPRRKTPTQAVTSG